MRDGVARMARDIAIPLIHHMHSLKDGDYGFGVRSNHLFLNRRRNDDVEIPATVELTEINGSETFIHATHDTVELVIQEKGVRSVQSGVEITMYVSPDCFFVYDKTGALVASPTPEAFRG
ncbi:MAG: hypothetical protein U5R49_13670 [Deltaproteobacteria bacterium]|nr:hypothetical protein [Deltaproteobacteria bacterium]